METDRLTDRMGSVPIGTMLYFDGDGHGDGMCKQAFTDARCGYTLKSPVNMNSSVNVK